MVRILLYDDWIGGQDMRKAIYLAVTSVAFAVVFWVPLVVAAVMTYGW